MPQQVTPEMRERYIRALEMRDNGSTFREIASALQFTHSMSAHNAWIGGLRLANRNNEIPVRNIRVQINGVPRVLTATQLESFTLNSEHTFGIEFECIGLTQRDAFTALNAHGVLCVDEGYHHHTRPTWKVVPDGSLHGGGGRNCEVVSPILKGSDGLTEVRTVAAILRAAGATVNNSCGMHIHTGAESLTLEHQVRILQAYQVWQGAFSAFLNERRVNGSWGKMRSAQAWAHLIDRWSTTIDSSDRKAFAHGVDRLHALNVHAYYRHGTFEFRSHHGSLNGTNAAAWLSLHTAFVEACRYPISFAELVLDSNQTPETNAARGYYTPTLANHVASRAELVESGKALVATLNGMRAHGEPLLNNDVARYLTARAGNIPSSRSARA